MYIMLCTKLDICYSIWIISRYKSNFRCEYWTSVKDILKYLRNTKSYFLIYKTNHLLVMENMEFDFQTDKNDRKSMLGMIFMMGGEIIIWRSAKQKPTTNSTSEIKYIPASDASKKGAWLKKFLNDLKIVPELVKMLLHYIVITKREIT